MNTSTSYAVIVRISPEDFERLSENSGNLHQAFPALYERLRDGGKPAVMRRPWRQIYWTGQEYVNLLLARSFLEAIGEDYQVVVDEGADETGRANGWAILTNYLSPVWARLAEES